MNTTTTATAVMIPVMGDVTTVTIGANDSLADLQRLVGGDIQLVPLPHGLSLVINEEGKLHGLPVNHRATEALCAYLLPGDFLVGTTLMIGPEGSDESTLDADLAAAGSLMGVTLD